ncbi:MAG TPA: hypothetical protein VGR93_01405 [Candidatus Acidoferrales bacterium]|nr:hypothetical protein [Candidatus Acidoferrales bacterium]
MKPKHVAFAAFLLAGFAFSGALAPPACAQVTTGKTITVKVKAPKPTKPKMETFKGQVVRMNTVSIIVRDNKNSYIVRTFTFSPALAKKLQSLIDRGGYQPGDNVTISYPAGSTVAQSIKGKASKAF